MPRQIIDLSQKQWQFGPVPRRPYDTADIYDLPLVTEWLPAAVPGNVRTDLLRHNRIPNPFFGECYKDSLWTEDVDWWYRCALAADSFPSPAARAFLIFEGIDYQFAIFINRQEVDRAQGMFSRRTIDLTPLLRAGGGRLEIAVRLWGSGALPRRQLNRLQRIWQNVAGRLYAGWAGIYPNRSATLKCQMSFGWDFAPPIRTMGIWDEVRLVLSGSVFIEEASAHGYPKITATCQTSPLTGPRQTGLSTPTCKATTSAQFSVDLTLNSNLPCLATATIRLKPANFAGPAAGPYHFSLDIPAGKSMHRLRFQLPQAEMWQPWDRGYPHLYQLRIRLTGPDNHLLDEMKIRTGIRSIVLDRWQLHVNGRREFIRGLNWVPGDCFPGRLRSAHYERLLTLARTSGANLLRVWGGGLREKQHFYDLCDQTGLMVWQEFPFACMFLGAYPRNRSYLAQVQSECGAIVRQLRHHPAIALWCGGNEFSRWRNRPLLKVLAAVVAEHDATRPFIPVSPSFGPYRDTHNWHVWHGEAPIKTFQTENAQFLSEFGLQALPTLDTLTAALPNVTDIHNWPSHQADLPKLARYSAPFLDQDPAVSSPVTTELLRQVWPTSIKPESRPVPDPDAKDQAATNDLKTLINASQLAQAVALQTAIEHMRRRKGSAGGVCLWQFNEPWPAISWAIVDYFGRPKLAYRELLTWYQPILVSLKFPVGQPWQAGQTFVGEVWAINDSLDQYSDCQLRIELDGTTIQSQSIELNPDCAYPVGQLCHRLTAPPQTLSLILTHKGRTICHNSYNLGWTDLAEGRLQQRFRRWLAEWALR